MKYWLVSALPEVILSPTQKDQRRQRSLCFFLGWEVKQIAQVANHLSCLAEYNSVHLIEDIWEMASRIPWTQNHKHTRMKTKIFWYPCKVTLLRAKFGLNVNHLVNSLMSFFSTNRLHSSHYLLSFWHSFCFSGIRVWFVLSLSIISITH